jgi:hypothetical protein
MAEAPVVTTTAWIEDKVLTPEQIDAALRGEV